MATEQEVVDIIIKPMISFYRAPDGMNGDTDKLVAVKTQFVRALSPYTARALESAWDRVISRHYGWEWPTLQEIVREASLCS